MKFTALFASLIILTSISCTVGQALPDKIRGYKVYEANVEISNTADNSQTNRQPDAVVKLLDPKVADFGLFGATIEVGAEITTREQAGEIDMITFGDLRVNGIAVEAEEYTHSFSIRKGGTVYLPVPARVSIRITDLVRAAYSELLNKHEEMTLTGTAFVFGKFKRSVSVSNG